MCSAGRYVCSDDFADRSFLTPLPRKLALDDQMPVTACPKTTDGSSEVRWQLDMGFDVRPYCRDGRQPEQATSTKASVKRDRRTARRGVTASRGQPLQYLYCDHHGGHVSHPPVRIIVTLQ